MALDFTVRWDDNTDQLRQRLAQGLSQIDATKESIDRLTKSLSGETQVRAADRWAQALKQLGGEAGSLAGVEQLTRGELERANLAFDKQIEKLNALGVAVPQDVAAMKELASARLADITAGERQADALQAQIQKLNEFSSAAKSIGIGLSATITAPLVALGYTAVKASIDFETAFAGVRKTVSGTPAELQQLNQQLREMALTTPVSAVGLANIAESAGQLGVAKDKITDFTKTIVDISSATHLTTEEASTAFAKLANVTRLPQEQFANLGSAVVALGNFGASTEQEMLSMAQRIAAAGATAGLNTAQILGIANALSSVGIEAEAGGTAVSRVLSKMAGDVATGGGHLGDFAKVAGLSAQQFADAFKKDAGNAFTLFIQGLAQAKDKGESLFPVLDELGLKDARLRNALLSAANAGDLMNQSIELGKKAFSENTELARAAGERYGTTANQLKILENKFNDVKITLGDALVPVLKDLVSLAEPVAGAASSLAKEFAALPEPVRLVAVGVGALAAAGGPAIFVLGQLAGSVAKLIPLMNTLAGSEVFVKLTSSLGSASGALGLFGLAGTAAVGAYLALEHETEEWKKRVDAAVAPQKTLAGQIQYTTAQATAARAALGPLADDWTHVTLAVKAGAGATQDAGKANETLAQKVADLSAAQRADIDLKRQQGESIKAITQETGIASDVVSAYLKQTHAATQEQKNYAEALNRYNSIDGPKYLDLISKIGNTTYEGIAYDHARGISVKDLATVYRTTSTVVDAVIKSEKDYAAQQKFLGSVVDETKKSHQGLAIVIPDLSDRTRQFGFAMEGLTKDGLLPTVDALGDESRAHIVAANAAAEQQRSVQALAKQVTSLIGLMPDLSTIASQHMKAATASTNEWVGALDVVGRSLTRVAGVDLTPVIRQIEQVYGKRSTDGTAPLPALTRQDVNTSLLTGALTGAGAVAEGDSTAGALGKAGIAGATAATAAAIGTTATIGASIALGAATFGIGAAAVGVAVLLKNLLTVSEAEKDARKNLEEFIKPFGTLDVAIQSVGEAYRILGKSGTEAQSDLQAALDASHVSAEAEAAAIGKINGVLAESKQRAHDVSAAVASLGPAYSATVKGLTGPILAAFAAANDADSALQGGIAGLGDGMQKASKYTAGLGTEIADLQAKIATLNTKSSLTPNQAQQLVDYKTKLLTLQDEYGHLTDSQKTASDALDTYASNSKQALDDLGLTAVTSFAAMIAGGSSVVDAFKSIGPSLTDLQSAYADLGLSVDDVAVQNLLMQNTVLTGNPQLIGAIDGLASEMEALNKLGVLNSDTLAALERTGQRTYSSLQSAVAAVGGSTKDALIPMQAYLHDAANEAQQLGVPLEDNTQSLIDQSKELGIWKDAGKDATTALNDSTAALNDTMKALIDSLTGPGGLTDAFKGIPSTLDVTVVRHYVDASTSGSPDGAATGGFVMPGGIQHFAFGGFVPSGTDTVPAMLTPGEMILNAAQQRNVGSVLSAAELAQARGNDRDEITALRDDLKGLHRTTLRLTRYLTQDQHKQIARAVRDQSQASPRRRG